jgi:hypothetical protein
MPLLRRFQQLAGVTTVVDATPVKTTRLDDVPEIERIDFLKMDVQGAELDVIRGAERLLDSTSVIQLEVEFVPMYKDQPLFGDLDRELRNRGFIFHCFLSQSGRMFQPFAHPGNVSAHLRQTLWAEALYVRDFMRLREREPGSLLRMAAILHEVYSSYDLLLAALIATPALAAPPRLVSASPDLGDTDVDPGLLPDGMQLDGRGVTPDVSVRARPDEFELSDPVLEAALRILRADP